MSVDERISFARGVVREAMDRHRAAGGEIRQGIWGVDRVPSGKPGIDVWAVRPGAGCCALGCVLAGREVPYATRAFAGEDLVAEATGMTYGELTALMAGFDGRKSGYLLDNPFWQLGRELAAEYLP